MAGVFWAVPLAIWCFVFMEGFQNFKMWWNPIAWAAVIAYVIMLVSEASD